MEFWRLTWEDVGLPVSNQNVSLPGTCKTRIPSVAERKSYLTNLSCVLFAVTQSPRVNCQIMRHLSSWRTTWVQSKTSATKFISPSWKISSGEFVSVRSSQESERRNFARNESSGGENKGTRVAQCRGLLLSVRSFGDRPWSTNRRKSGRTTC